MGSAFLYVVLLYLLDVLTTNGENVNNNTAATTLSSQVGKCIGVVCGYRSFCNWITSSCECSAGSTVELTIHDPSGSSNIRVVYCLKFCSENDRCTAADESCVHDDESNTDLCLCSTGYSRSWSFLGHCRVNPTTTTHSFPVNNSTTTNTHSSQDNVPLYIGLGIACATSIVLLAVLFLLLRRRRNNQGDQNNHGKPRTGIDDRRDPSPATETGNSANQEYTEIDDDLRIRDVSDYLELSNRSSQPTAEYIHAISGHEYLEPSCTPKYSALDDKHVEDNYIDNAHEYLTLAIGQKNCATHYDIISKDNF